MKHGFRYILLIVILAGLAVLMACRGSIQEDAEIPGKTTITWMIGVDYYRSMYEELIASFEKQHPDIHVQVMWVPGSQYQTKLKTLIAANQAPDIFYAGDVWVAYLLPYLGDVTELVERDRVQMELDDIYPELMQACQWKGKYYFVPRWFNLSLLYYNKTLFQNAKVAYPNPNWTWNDYIQAAQKLTKKDSKGKVDIWGSTVTYGWWGEWLVLVRQSGGEMFNDEISRCTLNTPEARGAMQFYYDKVYKYKCSPRPGYEPNNMFASGRMAMEFGGHTGNWLTYNKFSTLDWDIEILPKGPQSRVGGELALDALGMSKTTLHREQAWEFMKFMCSKESIRRHAKEGFIPIRKSIAEETLLQPGRKEHPQNVAAVYDALKYARQIPKSPDYIELALDVIQPDVDKMLIDGINPQETSERITKSVNQYLETMGSRIQP